MVICHVFHEFVYQYDPWNQCCHVLIHLKKVLVFIVVHGDCLHIYDEPFSCFHYTINYLSIKH